MSRPFGGNGTPAFLSLASEKADVVDAMASIIGHGLAGRFPRLKFMPIEIQSGWIRPFVTKLKRGTTNRPGCSTRIRSRCSPATCGCTRSTSRIPRA